MTHKERTIRAIHQLIKNYEHPDPNNLRFGSQYFVADECPLCTFRFDPEGNINCEGCVLGLNPHGDFAGCCSYRSFIDAKEAFDQYQRSSCPSGALQKNLFSAFQKRAKFWRKVLLIIDQWPEERFTKRGAKDQSGEIPFEW